MSSLLTPTTERPWNQRLPFFYGWVVLLAGGIGMFISAPGQTYVVSIFVDPIIEDLNWSRTTISGLYTAGSLTAALAVPFVGRLLDRFGGRVVLAVVAGLFGIATLSISGVHEPFHLFLGFVGIRALGQGSLSLISTTLAAIWFVRLRGRAIAIMSLASPASQAAFPILVFYLIAQFGWRNTWVILAFIIWITLIPTAVILVRRSPESVGLFPDGDRPIIRNEPSASTPSAPGNDDWTLREAVRTRTFWLLLFAGAPLSLIGTALAFHHISIFASKDLGPVLAAGVLGFMAPMALIGTFVSGFLADKIANRLILAAGQVLFAVALVWVLTISTPWQAFVYGGLLGFGQGMIMTINTIIWPNYFGRAHLGSIRGVAATAMVTFSALGPLPFGYMFDISGDYNTAIMAFLGLPIACALISLLATAPQRAIRGDAVEKEPPPRIAKDRQ